MGLRRTPVAVAAAGMVLGVAPGAALADDISVIGDYTVPAGTTGSFA